MVCCFHCKWNMWYRLGFCQNKSIWHLYFGSVYFSFFKSRIIQILKRITQILIYIIYITIYKKYIYICNYVSILYIYICVYIREGNGNPLQYSCLENESLGQRSLVGYSPWARKQLVMTEELSTHAHTGDASGFSLFG